MFYCSVDGIAFNSDGRKSGVSVVSLTFWLNIRKTSYIPGNVSSKFQTAAASAWSAVSPVGSFCQSVLSGSGNLWAIHRFSIQHIAV